MPATAVVRCTMNDAAVKAAVSLFIKNVSYQAQRELEKVVRAALADGMLQFCVAQAGKLTDALP